MTTIEAECTACGKAMFAMTDDAATVMAAYLTWDECHKAACAAASPTPTTGEDR